MTVKHFYAFSFFSSNFGVPKLEGNKRERREGRREGERGKKGGKERKKGGGKAVYKVPISEAVLGIA